MASQNGLLIGLIYTFPATQGHSQRGIHRTFVLEHNHFPRWKECDRVSSTEKSWKLDSRSALGMIIRFAFDNVSEAVIVSDELGLPRVKDIAFELVMGENCSLEENESYWQLLEGSSFYAGLGGMVDAQLLEVMPLPGGTLSGIYLGSASRGRRFGSLQGGLCYLDSISQIG